MWVWVARVKITCGTKGGSVILIASHGVLAKKAWLVICGKLLAPGRACEASSGTLAAV